ncbi:MAG: DUF262 domain-containing protein [Muribaculaceae bacterium]|nr:DUF262 domain-containing protein [Muribaculaceae bacterium]
MTTTTFKSLIADSNDYGIKGVIIPRIQRSYAQGRSDVHAVKTRERFLSAIHSGLTGSGLTLDFIYGNIRNADRQLIPLDGQQRLTTLWLLHWYADKKENIRDSRLSRFSYHTRPSARDFIAKLVGFIPTWEMPLSDEIRNQGWFPMEWDNDPTVSGMLTMLDEIQTRFADIDDMWNRLDKINFYFRDIEEMSLTDDIYIKMNSRGKPLTDFEHFKAELLKVMRNDNESVAKRIGLKIDREWTDMLWSYRDSDNLVDNAFLNFFRFISLILIYKEDRSAREFDTSDDFDLLERLYKGKGANVEFLENAFDCMVEIHKKGGEDPDENADAIGRFFSVYLSADIHQSGKVVVPRQIGRVNIFREILENDSMKNKPYWVTLFYSFLISLMNPDRIEDSDFRRRLRVVVNLLKNSGNEVVDSPGSDAGNRLPAILKQVESIILSGEIAECIEIDGERRYNFSAAQMEEERRKLKFTAENPDKSEGLFELEDFYLLDGRVDVVGYENVRSYKRFLQLFTECSRDAIDCAMLSIGDYSQRINNWCVQLGSSDGSEAGNNAWHALFHPSGKTVGYDQTKKSLRTLLESDMTLNDSSLNKKSEAYIEECRRQNLYDWRYYYIAYPAFRAGRYGKYTMYEGQPYSLVALHSKKRESSNAYQCMLMALIESSAVATSADWYDTRHLTFKKGLLTCTEDAFVSTNLNDGEERSRFSIQQNIEGIDTVDRIQDFRDNRRNEERWIRPEEISN